MADLIRHLILRIDNSRSMRSRVKPGMTGLSKTETGADIRLLFDTNVL